MTLQLTPANKPVSPEYIRAIAFANSKGSAYRWCRVAVPKIVKTLLFSRVFFLGVDWIVKQSYTSDKLEVFVGVLVDSVLSRWALEKEKTHQQKLLE